MKKLFLYFVFLIFIIPFTIVSQPCLPQGIELTSQSQIDNFPINHPNCSEIEGDVLIGGADINNLNGLSALVSIRGDLLFKSNNMLTDLTGLENLESISGSLFIGKTYFGTPSSCSGNPSLTSLTGLNGLTHIDGSLEIYCNDNLENFSGLENLTTIGEDLHIGTIDNVYYIFFGNESLIDCSGLNSLTSVGGTFSAAANTKMINFEGLNNLVSIGGNFMIAWNYALEDFSGLEQLSTGIGEVFIYSNTALISLSGLESLVSIEGDLFIGDSPLLSELNPLNNLTYIGGNLEITNNDLLADISGLNNIAAESIVNLIIHGNSSLADCSIYSICQYLVSSNGIIAIYDNAGGCNSEQEVLDSCDFTSVTDYKVVGTLSVRPNPFSTSTTIEYELTKPSTVQLIIYDYLGKQVEVIEKNQIQGKQQIIWNAEGLPAGIYFCILKTNEGVQTTKIIKL